MPTAALSGTPIAPSSILRAASCDSKANCIAARCPTFIVGRAAASASVTCAICSSISSLAYIPVGSEMAWNKRPNPPLSILSISINTGSTTGNRSAHSKAPPISGISPNSRKPPWRSNKSRSIPVSRLVNRFSTTPNPVPVWNPRDSANRRYRSIISSVSPPAITSSDTRFWANPPKYSILSAMSKTSRTGNSLPATLPTPLANVPIPRAIGIPTSKTRPNPRPKRLPCNRCPA